MSRQSRRPETEPELIFEPIEDPEPRPDPSPPEPDTAELDFDDLFLDEWDDDEPKLELEPEPEPEPEPTFEEIEPEPPPPPQPPELVPAGVELHAEVLQRDRRGRVVGDRLAVVCSNELELIHAVAALSRLLTLSGVRWWTAGPWHLLEGGHEGMAREMFSSRLDAALDALGLGGARGVRLYVGGRGVFVPYTGTTAAWDVRGDLPLANDDTPPQIFDPEHTIPADAWVSQPVANLLPRMAPRPRISGHSGQGESELKWILASARIFPAILGWTRDAGLEISFTLLRSESVHDESVLIHVRKLQDSDRRLFTGLPEVHLLWDPLADPEDIPRDVEQVPAVLVDREHEPPVHLRSALYLTDLDRPVIFRGSDPPRVLDGPIPLTPGTALLRPQLAHAPERLQRRDAPRASVHLPLSLVRHGKLLRTRALLLTPHDLRHLAVLRDHLPWSVTSHAQIAPFEDVAFVLLGEDAVWDLPIGLPYGGDDVEAVYIVRGWTISPEVPSSVIRRAAEVNDDEVAFLSPARLWCVPRQAFQPLVSKIRLRRDLSRMHLDVEAARFDEDPVFPELQWPEEEPELEMVEVPAHPGPPPPPASRSRLLQEARDAFARGEHEKAAVLFERVSEYTEAAKIYDGILAGAKK